MLNILFLYITIIINILGFATALDSKQDPGLLFSYAGKQNKTFTHTLPNTNTISSYNATYIDKAENILLMPNLKNNYVEQKSKRKIKKSPKRTIQKIIKKSKSRRKLYINSIQPTQPTQVKKIDSLDKGNVKEELLKKVENKTKFEANQKKNQRKYNSKLVRYSMPFQRLAAQKNSNFHRRNKREQNREDVFILEDLDEMEFLNKGKDSNIVKAHVKQYW
ncbi:uncharacterized protein LOC113514502 [Galleria mellonella]|uniref:Uncharacterized protein LOC113514502 n=1 Tax=Galleria mellonella TaxID=7137 RepID=A0A6J3BV21_GALME|nr:uncharacterized protein LOC113514502 [Galleria mellonella]